MTARRFEGGRLVIATHNKGKLAEMVGLLGAYAAPIESAGALGLPEPEETGATFAENAVIKALFVARAAGCPALADDSGLCVRALGEAPGIFSARWGGEGQDARDFLKAMARVNDELGASEDRAAHFACALTLAWPDGHVEKVEGRVEGVIAWPPRGTGGHGYDPIFVPEGDARSFAEMTADEKGALSHRGRAMRALIARCFA